MKHIDIRAHSSKMHFKTDLSELLNRIMSRKAILFVGAGFSTGSKNIKNQSPPTAKQLSKRVAHLGNFEEDEDLMFTSDYYMANNDVNALITLLKELYTIKSTQKHHEIICSMPWRRIYTTNYDNLIEVAARNAGLLIESISLDKSPELYYKQHNLCVHINGNIENLNEHTIVSSFKLSASSYISPDSFTASSWYYPFKKDLERCSAIVFAGYSLYDIDIQKILKESPELKTKTYFITKPNPGRKILFTFERFGTVIQSGIENFAKDLKSHYNNYAMNPPEFYTEAFVEYTIQEIYKDIDDRSIQDFIMHGALDEGHIANAVTGSQRKPYMINRPQMDKIMSIIRKEQYAIICSELGNGKSVFCKQLLVNCALENKKAFYLKDGEGDYLGDIERLEARKINAILIVEGYEKYPDLIQYFATINPKRLKLILCSRSSSHERMRQELTRFNLTPYEINLDLLDKMEISQFVKIIDNLGYWGSDAHLSHSAKCSLINNTGQKQISHTLLKFFDSPQIKERLSALVGNLSKNESFKMTLFAICLAESLDLPLNPSLISEISSVDDIYKLPLREDSNFRELYRIRGGAIESKSSLFSLHLLKNHFSPPFVVDSLLRIVGKYYDLRSHGRVEEDIYKSLLKFSFIERILPVTNKRNSLIKYYEELKVQIPWMQRNPHYWLQYGMARVLFKEYGTADAYYEQAYSLANNIDGYDTSYIDTQKARLELLKSLELTDRKIAFEHFIKANALLYDQNDDVYKYRQVALYKDFFDTHYKELTAKNKTYFMECCKKLHGRLQATYPANPFMHAHASLRLCYDKLSEILENIGR